MTQPWLQIVGIGEDGFAPLPPAAKQAITTATHLYAALRHLTLIPPDPTQPRTPWPTPMAPAIDHILTTRIPGTTVLASGDPMLYGVGVLLTRNLLPEDFRIHPSLSAFTLACARLGWSSASTRLISLVNRPLEQLARYLTPNHRLILLSEDETTPNQVAAYLTSKGYAQSTLQILANLNGPTETITSPLRAESFPLPSSLFPLPCLSPLNVIALTCHGPAPFSLVPGLPDEAFETDGQFTKREVRAATLARLAPLPGDLLWDVGAGTGTLAIEWLRQHPSNQAIAFELREDRASRIAINARSLGTPNLQVIPRQAPEAFAGLEAPDAIFLGGGLTPALFEACWQALKPGGRLVVNAVTLDSEAALIQYHSTLGGDLTRIQISRAERIGAVTGWRPLMPITQLALRKP